VDRPFPDKEESLDSLRDGPVTVLIVARVRMYREGLAASLAAHDRLDVAGTAADAGSGLVQAVELQPDVVLVDLEMPKSVVLVRACARTVAASKVLALTMSDSEEELVRCAEAGIAGYVTHESSIDELVETVESASRGEMRCSPRAAAVLVRHVGALARHTETGGIASRLTARELEILELIDAGRSNKEIACELCIEVPTVKNHVHHILEKLSVRRRAEAAAKLRAHGRLVLR
jgi:DNA-binding NarL/FixJ family response regulator